MKRRTFLMCLSLAIVIIAITPLLAADPPAKAPEAEEALSEAQQSLLLQLSDAEANIRALNLALVRTGYKVGIAYKPHRQWAERQRTVGPQRRRACRLAGLLR